MNKINEQNDNKYRKVLEFLSKEIYTTDAHRLHQQQQSLLSLLEKSQGHQKQQQQQLVSLNDIDFPDLFMY